MLTECQAITTYFRAAWPHTAIAWPNVVFQPPSGAAWIRFNLLPISGEQISIGAPSISRYFGLVHVTVFMPQGGGDERMFWLADRAIEILSKRSLPLSSSRSLTLETAYASQPGDTQDGWAVISVTCPFFFDLLN